MRIASVVLVFGGCNGSPASKDTGSASTGPTTQVLYEVWETDRACWALREFDRPAEYWEDWYDQGCDVSLDGSSSSSYGSTSADFPQLLADADGLCARLAIPDWCEIVDPFILSCDAVPGCCELDVAGPRCFPNAWEP
ncbi:MAG: hypothetical protein ABMA64_24825 [Myxococcota bacterium]